MKESSSNQASYIDRMRSWARTHAYGGTNRSPATSSEPTLPLSNHPSHTHSQPSRKGSNQDANSVAGHSVPPDGASNAQQEKTGVPDSEHAGASVAPASEAEGKGTVLNPDQASSDQKPNVATRFLAVARKVVLHSWINVLLVFVPIGIAVAVIPNMSPGLVFAMNAVAIIPLAGLLSHATESVAHRLGDTLGALINVSFGNAVELIIFVIALVKNEIRIVQASLLGSILANLLLILGMAFFLGGLRYREQIYNSTVTQMSACLLSLSVISLVLPTAFHASFSDQKVADANSLIISRGTSVVCPDCVSCRIDVN